MRKIFSYMLVALFTGIVSLATAQNDPKAGAALDEMSKKYKEMAGFKATFTYDVENTSHKLKESGKGDIAVKGSKYKLKLADQEIFNNGTTVWTYIKSNNEVNITDYEPDPEEITPDKIYTMYKKGYKYILQGEQNVDGVIVQIIDLEPIDRNGSINKIRLVIGKKDKYLKSWKIFENTGTVHTYTIKTFTPDVQLPDTEFSFDKNKFPNVIVNDLRY